jgi:general stress protein YciG
MTQKKGACAPTRLGGEQNPRRPSRDSEVTSPRSPSDSESQRTAPITAICFAIVGEFERRRLALGSPPQDKLSEFAGVPDRAYAKWIISPHTSSGRQPSWPSLQRIADVLYPDGFQLRITARQGPALNALSHKFSLRYDKIFADARTRREQLAEWGRQGGLRHDPQWMVKIGRRGGRARVRRQSKEKRSEVARLAARARWGNDPKTKKGQRHEKPTD